MRLPLLMAAILSVSVSASAEPILYTFTASLTVSKRNADIPQQPLSAFDDAFWFPTLHDGQTYAADGWIECDPSLFEVGGPGLVGPDMVFVHLGLWTFSIDSSLGFVAGDAPLAPAGDTGALAPRTSA